MQTSKSNTEWKVAELSFRLINKPAKRVKVSCPKDAYHVFMQHWDMDSLYVEERVAALFMNNSGEVIGYKLLSIGGLRVSTINIPQLIKYALVCNASGVIVAHNHPSGNLIPSANDNRMANKLTMALRDFDLDLNDWMILTGNGFFWSKVEFGGL